MDAATWAAVVFVDLVALHDGVSRARPSAVRACRTTLEFVAFFRKHRAPVKDFFCSPGITLLLSTTTWTCINWSLLKQRFRVARPPLSFRPNGQHVGDFTKDIATSAGRPERPKTSAQAEVAGARGVGAQFLGTSFDMRCDFACPRLQTHRSCGRGGRGMHVARESASNDAGFVRHGELAKNERYTTT